MQEFLLIFRNAPVTEQVKPSPEEIQNRMKPWMDWLGGIGAQNKLVSAGNRLDASGNVLKPSNVLINGPYVEVAEAVGGYSIIRAASLQEATELSKGCPILARGGSVEVRAIIPMEM